MTTTYRTIRGAHCEHPEGANCPNCLTLPVLTLPEPWRPNEVQMLEAAGIDDPARQREKTTRLALSYRTGRPPIAPGVLLEDDEARVYVSRGVLRVVVRWAVGFGMIVTGAAVMFAEGQMQAQPGPGFAVGLAFIVGAAFLVAGRANKS